MITRIELTNFMSHEHTVIEPAAGLTVLVGPNNCGKSAVVAALQILCSNDPAAFAIRHGEKACEVAVHTDDGHVIEWRRTNDSSRYLIDGQLRDRLGRSKRPDELRPALRLGPIDAENNDDPDFDVHFGTQKSPIFLLGSSGASAARFFASSSDASRLMAMQKRHKDKLTAAKSEKNRLEADSRRVNAELDLLAPVIGLDQELAAAEGIYAEAMQRNVWLAEAEFHCAALNAQSKTLDRQTVVVRALAPLAPPPELQPVETLASAIETVDACGQSFVLAQARSTALSALPTPLQLADAASLAVLTCSLANSSHAIAHHIAQQRSLASLATRPELDDTASLADIVERLAATIGDLARVGSRRVALQPLAAPPHLTDDVELTQLLGKFERIADEFARRQRECSATASLASAPILTDTADLMTVVGHFEAAATEVTAAEHSLNKVIELCAQAAARLREQAAGQFCPLCGAAIDPERLVETAAAGLGGHQHG